MLARQAVDALKCYRLVGSSSSDGLYREFTAAVENDRCGTRETLVGGVW